jgi:hypothetical protein
MGSAARLIEMSAFEIVVERLASVSRRIMRPVSVIVVSPADPLVIAAGARDSDTVAAEGPTVWLLCPDTGVTGAAILAERLLESCDSTANAHVVAFPHAVVDPAEIVPFARSFSGVADGGMRVSIAASGDDDALDLTSEASATARPQAG